MKPSNQVPVIGVTGAVASGKSAVTAAFGRRGAVVFDADKVGHAQLDRSEVVQELAGKWGNSILDEDGRVVRAEIARRVFADSAEAAADRLFLEQSLHPRIRREIEHSVQQLASVDVAAAVVEAALLFEVGWNGFCDWTIFVDAPTEIRRQRALARGWTKQQFDARQGAQMPAEQKRPLADFVVDNSGTLEQLDLRVEKLWTELFPAEQR